MRRPCVVKEEGGREVVLFSVWWEGGSPTQAASVLTLGSKVTAASDHSLELRS